MAQVFETADLDEVAGLLRSSYASCEVSAPDRRGGLRIVQQQLPQARLDHVTYHLQLDVDIEPLGVIPIARALDGRACYRDRHGERLYQKGDVYFTGQSAEAVHANLDNFDTECVLFDPALLTQIAQGAPGDPGPIRLLDSEPLTPAAAQQWWRAYDAVVSITTQPDQLASPLVTANAARLLAAVTLATFPNTTLVEPTIEDRHDAHLDALRRAVAFIEANPHRDITIADIAAAAFVSARAVQLAFRRHLDTTPMGYLRRVRLDRAHHDLVAADPDRDSVTAIAVRWGFSHLSRFAAYYRSTYGVAPSHVLSESGDAARR